MEEGSENEIRSANLAISHSTFRIPHFKKTAFTLVEMIAAMAVLAILGLLIFQVTTATSNTTKISNRAVDATAQARIVFDRLGSDLAAMLRRPDIDTCFGAGADLLDFFSAVPGPDPVPPPAGFKNRGISRILYRLEKRPENQNRLCLLRAAKAAGWADAGFFGLRPDGYPVTAEDSGYPATLLATAGDFDVLGQGVVVMVLGYQLYPDNEPAYFEGDTAPSIPYSHGQVVYRPPMRGKAGGPEGLLNGYVDLNRISALVVGIVVLDLDTLATLTETQVDALAGAFTTAIPQGEMPVSRWMKDTNNLSVLPGIPLPAKQAVRIYQRVFPITYYGEQNS